MSMLLLFRPRVGDGVVDDTPGARIDTRIVGTNTLAGREVATYTVATKISGTTAVSDSTRPAYRIDTRIR
jgi:hypothetical protein